MSPVHLKLRKMSQPPGRVLYADVVRAPPPTPANPPPPPSTTTPAPGSQPGVTPSSATSDQSSNTGATASDTGDVSSDASAPSSVDTTNANERPDMQQTTDIEQDPISDRQDAADTPAEQRTTTSNDTDPDPVNEPPRYDDPAVGELSLPEDSSQSQNETVAQDQDQLGEDRSEPLVKQPEMFPRRGLNTQDEIDEKQDAMSKNWRSEK